MSLSRRSHHSGLTAAVALAALLLSGSASIILADAAPTAARHTPAVSASSMPSQPDALDGMTRDGPSGAAADGNGANAPNAAGSMNIGVAVLRALLSLGVVLALVVGAIKYLKRKGYGIALPQAARPPENGAAIVAPKPQFGVSPLAQLLISARQTAVPAQTVKPQPSDTRGISGFEVLGTQSLPGSAHTLYKIRVGERVLLLGGTPSGSLSLLTEWDTETPPEAAGRRFDEMLDELELTTGGAYPALQSAFRQSHSSGNLQSAASRLSAAVRRASAAPFDAE